MPHPTAGWSLSSHCKNHKCHIWQQVGICQVTVKPQMPHLMAGWSLSSHCKTTNATFDSRLESVNSHRKTTNATTTATMSDNRLKSANSHSKSTTTMSDSMLESVNSHCKSTNKMSDSRMESVNSHCKSTNKMSDSRMESVNSHCKSTNKTWQQVAAHNQPTESSHELKQEWVTCGFHVVLNPPLGALVVELACPRQQEHQVESQHSQGSCCGFSLRLPPVP